VSYRKDKISSLIKDELSLIFLQKLKDSSFSIVTITNVVMSPDLKNAKIYFSVFERDKREITLEKINEIKPLIRSELAHRVRMRFVPELSFFIDDTSDYVEKINSIFEQIHKNDNKKNE